MVVTRVAVRVRVRVISINSVHTPYLSSEIICVHSYRDRLTAFTFITSLRTCRFTSSSILFIFLKGWHRDAFLILRGIITNNMVLFYFSAASLAVRFVLRYISVRGLIVPKPIETSCRLQEYLPEHVVSIASTPFPFTLFKSGLIPEYHQNQVLTHRL